ncbi:DUF6782 family putative metallopeptidase [Nocardia sp. NPDC049190]|uniref:DUF6782 family putative metallopeptidase n=1 Tax=Nocardia sp. NPDC049190 TaxID=3155650 RepID=UPI0033D7E13F
MSWVAASLRRLVATVKADVTRAADTLSREYRRTSRNAASAAETLSEVDRKGERSIDISDAVSSRPGRTREFTGRPRVPHNPQIVAEFGREVAGLLAKSPTLSAKFRVLEQKGWLACYGEKDLGTYADRDIKTIVIDENTQGDPLAAVRLLAHEVGHAQYKLPAEIPYHGEPRAEWVEKNARQHFADEGEASLVEAQVLREIADNGGPRLQVSGAHWQQYEDIYDRYAGGDLTRSEARAAIGKIYEDEHMSGIGETYGRYFREFYRGIFDDRYGNGPKSS